MVREGHGEKDRVGSKIGSGSILIEGGAAFVVGPGQRGVFGVRSSLDQAFDAVGELVSGDILGVDVELVEDDFGHSSLHRVTTSAEEGLGIGQQCERGREELLAFVQLAGGVGELCLYLSALAFDVGQLLLDLRSGPLWVVQQVEQAVFLGLQLVQPGVHALLEAAEVALLQQQGVVELTAHCGLEVVAEPHRAQVCVHGGFDLGDGQVRQVAQVLLAASAQKVEVSAAVALAGDEHQSRAAAVTPEQALEPVVVSTLTSAPASTQGKHALNPVVGFLGDERLVPAWVLVVLVRNEAAVVAVRQNLVELAER